MIHSFLNGIDDGLEYSRKTLLIFTNIKYITVSDEFNVLTGYTVISVCGIHIHIQYTTMRVLCDALNVCTLVTPDLCVCVCWSVR